MSLEIELTTELKRTTSTSLLINTARLISSMESRLVSLVGKVLVYRAGGSGSIPEWTDTHSFKIIEAKVLPLL